MFTEIEKKILDATKPQYQYITRDGNGYLYLSVNRPSYNGKFLASQRGLESLNAFSHMFKDVKTGENPIRFRNPILDDIEREYLKAVFKPFAKRIYWATKLQGNKEYYIWVCMNNDDFMELPTFCDKEMYKGMEIDKHYSLAELGITYDN